MQPWCWGSALRAPLFEATADFLVLLGQRIRAADNAGGFSSSRPASVQITITEEHQDSRLSASHTWLEDN